MKLQCKTFFGAAVLTLALFLCIPAVSQGPADPTPATAATPETATAAPAASPEPPPNPAPQYPTGSSAGGDWRVGISIYGWFPGLHGTIGALGHNASVHVPFSDVFHTLKGIIPIAVEADKGRFLMPVDFLWIKLGVDNGIPINDFGQTSINTHVTESIFTPKLGYRLYDGEHLKVDALGGIRYWYVGLDNALEPSGLSNSRSANWVDGLGGARFILPLGEKAAITVAGDAGAGGANLDYQVAGLLNYNFTPKWGMALGWRYLYVDYRPSNHQVVFNPAMSGAVAGFTYNFGGKPPVPPTASCSVAPTEVWAGEPVTATLNTQNFNPKHTITYKWSSSGAKISGTSTTGSVDTAGLAPGSYTVSGTATDEKQKKNNVATCNASFAVKQPHPPIASCSASPDTVKAGEPSTVTVSASSPDNFPLTYAWSASAGSISGTGTSTTLDTTNAQPGSSITTTATVTDSRGLNTTCTATVNVLTPPVTVTVQEVKEIGECKFMNPKKPWRVDNECKATLDDVALRLQQEPNGTLVVVGYSDEEEKVKYEQLGAQRSVNLKYYLTSGEGGQRIDPSRIEPREGTKSDKSAKFYFMPSGATFTEEETVKVDETAIQGQSRSAAPAPKKKAKKAAASPSDN